MARHVLAVLCLSVGFVLLVSGCSAAAPAPSAPSRAPEGAPSAERAAGAAPSSADASNSTQRLVVRTAYMQLIVTDVEAVLDAVGKLSQEMGGYVVSSESRDQEGSRVGKASIRVPSDRLDDSIKRIKGMASKVDRASVGNKDVTDEYVDQDARLRSLRATEDQYLQIMKGARTTEDVLKIQQSLGQVREQIEKTQGRMQYLKQSTEMSVITMDIATTATAIPIDGAGWNVVETAYSAVQALVSAHSLLATLVIWVVVFAPVWVPPVLFAWWLERRSRRRYQQPPTRPAGGPSQP